MSDAAWGFWGSVIGSLIGGAIAYVVALKAAAVQTRDSWEIQYDHHQKELAWQLLSEIDDYVLCAFQPGETQVRQRAARRMLTTAALCMADQVPDIKNWCKQVDSYHHAQQNGHPLPEGITPATTQTFFDALQASITREYFDFTW